MERIDNTGFGDLKLIQDPEEFCYGIDAVLLADFTADFAKQERLRAAAGAVKALDFCTGTGVVPLILSYKTNWHITGVEIQAHSYELAEKMVKLNGLSERLDFIRDDVKALTADKMGEFDVISMNPPYTEAKAGLVCEDDAKLIARHETTAALEDFMKAASRLLKDKGDFFMIHKPSRLTDIFEYGRKYKLEPKELRMVVPSEGKAANLVLVHLVKNGGRQLKVLEQIAVRNEDGTYTEMINECYDRR